MICLSHAPFIHWPLLVTIFSIIHMYRNLFTKMVELVVLHMKWFMWSCVGNIPCLMILSKNDVWSLTYQIPVTLFPGILAVKELWLMSLSVTARGQFIVRFTLLFICLKFLKPLLITDFVFSSCHSRFLQPWLGKWTWLTETRFWIWYYGVGMLHQWNDVQ